MFRFRSENLTHLNAHNIRLSELNLPTTMSQPRKPIHLSRVNLPTTMSQPRKPIHLSRVNLPTTISQPRKPIHLSTVNLPTTMSLPRQPIHLSRVNLPTTMSQPRKPIYLSAVNLPTTMSQPRKPIHLSKVRVLRPAVRAGSSIRITNIKSIKPPDPEMVKKQEEEKLRAELQKEIVSRSRSCANNTYVCTLPVLSGKQYCAQHILKDPTAPYKQCAHTYSNGDRCQDPAPSEQRDHRDQGLCFDHARASLLARQRSLAPPPPVISTESLLNQLQHYIRPERARTVSCASSVSVVSEKADQDNGVPSAVDPFKQIDATAVNAQHSTAIMECASASDSDEDSVILGGPETTGLEAAEPRCETTPLWRAGVFTAEEAVCEAKNALSSLQAAYVRQVERLGELLLMERGHYLKALKAEKEHYCNISSQARSGPLTVRERLQLKKLKAYAGYHRKTGVNALLARKLHHKRIRGPDGIPRVSPAYRCSFTEGGVRCELASLPAAKHCRKHILLDSNQVLYQACGDPRGCGSCREPNPRLPLPTLACRYHASPPPYTTFTLKKDDSESDSDSHSSSDESRTEEFESPAKPDAPPPDAPYE